jgi:hypothetical protein
VNPVPLNKKNWKISGPGDHVKYDKDGDGATLALINKDSPRLHNTIKTGYGMYQARIKACKEMGCVAAFYVRRARRSS